MRAVSLLVLLISILACANPTGPVPAPVDAPDAPHAKAKGKAKAKADEPAPDAIPYYEAKPLEKSALTGLSLRELSLRRNTIYARVGNPFNKKWLRDYFAGQPWYHPLARAELEKLSEQDLANAQVIAEVESGIPADELRTRKADLPALEHRSAEDAIELDLLGAALGEYSGDPSVPLADRTPIEDPNTLDRKLGPDQIADLSRRDLRIARNTIFARHGRAFDSAILRAWFSEKGWYVMDPNYSDKRLTDVDKANIALLQTRENELGGPLTEEDHDFENLKGMVAA